MTNLKSQHESMGYWEANTYSYRKYLQTKPPKNDALKWFFFFIVGFVVGVMVFIIKNTITFIDRLKFKAMNSLLDHNRPSTYASAFLVYLSISLFLTLLASLICWNWPPAKGGGIPEVMAYLNGVSLRKVFNIRTLIAKTVGMVLGVSANLPIGQEGPLVHMGALVGAGLTQGRSSTLKFNLTFRKFGRFRNHRDRRDFVTAGAAAGVSAAFTAPVGGLLFVVEEVASSIDIKLMFMMLFGCFTSTYVYAVLKSVFCQDWSRFCRSPFVAFNYGPIFPVDAEKHTQQILWAIIPSIILGLIGGLVGALFTVVNMRINRFRDAKVRPVTILKVLEPCLITAVYSSICFFAPLMFSCIDKPEHVNDEVHFEQFNCNEHSYNPLASITLSGADHALERLFVRGQTWSSYGSLIFFFFFYSIAACIASGTNLVNGLFIPTLIMGATVGRLTGKVIDLLNIDTTWSDPGAWAMVGAAAMLGGVSRLTVSLTVIMVEMTGDLYFLLPVIIAIMVSKQVADHCNHPLFHWILEKQGVPFLDKEVNNPHLDLHNAGEIMITNPKVLKLHTTAREVASLLRDTGHGAFPVIEDGPFGDVPKYLPKGLLKGIVTREQLTLLLLSLNWGQKVVMDDEEDQEELNYKTMRDIEEAQFLTGAIKLPELSQEQLDEKFDLTTYVDTSPTVVLPTYSLRQTYTLFRSMGLRHLLVYDVDVLGIITRKDLINFLHKNHYESAPPLDKADLPDLSLPLLSPFSIHLPEGTDDNNL